MILPLWLLSVPLAIYGQSEEQKHLQPADSTPVIEDVEIVAPSDPSGEREQRPGVEILRKDSWQGRHHTLPDVLEKEAGIRVRRYGSTGSHSTVSIRGSTGSQVNVYLNGVLLNDGYAGQVNLSDLDLESIERIEVYRSGPPSRFTGSSIGGAINLVTVQEGASTGGRFRLSGGSYKTFQMSGGLRGGEEVFWDVAAKGAVSDMDFRYLNQNGTPHFNTLDDVVEKRKNAWFREGALGGGLSGRLSNTELSFRSDAYYKMHGLPGPSGLQAKDAKRKYLRSLSVLKSVSRGVIWDWLRIDTDSFYTEEKSHIFDPGSEFSYGLPGSKSRLQKFGGKAGLILYALDYLQTIRIYGGLEREIFHRDQRDELDQRQEKIPTRFRNLSFVHVEDEIAFFSRRLMVTPSIRANRITDRFYDSSGSYRNESLFESHVSTTEFTDYRVDAYLELIRGDKTSLYTGLSGSTQKRVPDFIERFGRGGSVIGNTDLKPEKSRNAEAKIGAKALLYGIGIQSDLTFFQRTVEDMILFVPNSQFTLRPENIDAADIRGVEWSTTIRFLSDWKIGSSYTYTKTKNESSVHYLKGNYLPLQPLHEWNGSIVWSPGKWEFAFLADYTGAFFRDRTNEYTGYVEPTRVYDFSAGRRFQLWEGPWGEQWNFTITVKNITDVRIEDVAGYPLPGRSIYATLSKHF